jgi:hypothetical protein
VVGFPVVEPAHLSLSPRLGMCICICIYLDLFQDFHGAILLVVGDVLVNSETPMVILSTSKYVGLVRHRCSYR